MSTLDLPSDHLYLFVIGVLLAVVGNILWYNIKSILQKKGYEISYIYGHFRELYRFYKIIKDETNSETKIKYLIGYISLLIIILLFVGFAIQLMVYPNSY